MEIKQNEQIDYEAQLIQRIEYGLNQIGYVTLYRSEVPSEPIATDVAKKFANKGYYVKIVYFNNGKMQSLVVSNTPLKETIASKVYSIFI